MKKIFGLMTVVCFFVLMSCTNSDGDSVGYKTPPPSVKDMEVTEPGTFQQPGGVVAEIEDNQGNPTNDSEFTIRE